MEGKFIVFEGIDGSGKTTQAGLLANYLKNKKANVVLTKNPTGGKVGNLVKEYYLKNNTFPVVDALLFAADRAEQVETVIKPALNKGDIVVSDRYYYSNWVYQSIEGVDMDWLMEINKFFKKPDLVFLIDVSPQTAIERIKSSRKSADIEKFEQIKTLENLSKKYLDLAKKEGMVVVDGGMEMADVSKNIIEEIEKIL